MVATETFRNNEEISGIPTYLNENEQVDENLVQNLKLHFPELPEYMIANVCVFAKKNPHYYHTKCLGKKLPTGKEKRKLKKWKPEEVGDVWFGETLEERKANGEKNAISQEEAQAFQAKQLEEFKDVIQPVEPDIKKIDELIEKI